MGAREESPLRHCEDDGVEISGGEGDAMVRSYWERGWRDGESLRRAGVEVRSFQGGGSWNSKVMMLVILYVLVRQIVFCPVAGWGGEMPAEEG